MGRIGTTLVKRTGKNLIQKIPDKCTTDFTLNKKLVEEAADIPSKKLRNLLAGYVTRLKKNAR